MPLSSKFQSDNFSTDGDIELGVRRALGLDGTSAGSDRPSQASRSHGLSNADRPKRGFAQDAKVDVVVVHGRRTHGQHGSDAHAAGGSSAINRVETAEAALKTEREARDRVERGLSEAQNLVRELQTKLGHTSLAIDEAREAARQSQAALLVAEAALSVEQNARETAEKALEEANSNLGATERRLDEMSTTKRPTNVIAASPAPRIIDQAPATRQPKVVSAKPNPISTESKPVRWWIKPKKA